LYFLEMSNNKSTETTTITEKLWLETEIPTHNPF